MNPSLGKTDFKTSIGLDTTNALNIVVGVPLKLINPVGLPAMDKMVIGLRFGQSPAGLESGGGRQQMADGNQQSIAGGSSAGIAGGGQMNAGGGGKGGMDNSPVEYWYKTNLAKR